MSPLTSRTKHSQDDVNKYRSRLVELNDRYIDDVQMMNTTFLFYGTQCRDPDSESGTEEAVREVGLELIFGESERIGQVQEAIRRIETGSYGVCIDCGEGISEERLTAIPYAKRCIQCKMEHEKII